MSAVVVTAAFVDGGELTAVRDEIGVYRIRADTPGGGFHLRLNRAEATHLRDQLTAALETTP